MDINKLSKVSVTDVTNFFTVLFPSDDTSEIKNRDHYGLSFCREGRIIYSHRGKEIVSDKNSVIILPKNQSYSIHGSKTGFFPVINFECAEFLCDTVTALPIKNTDMCISDYERMKNISLIDGNRTKVLSLFYNILHRIISDNSDTSGQLMPAIKYLERHYSDSDLSNKILAHQCNISEVYFRKLFVTQYNITPKQFIIDYRVSRAKQLLSDGVFKINSISEQCGFASPYHFCRIFKQKVGITPTEYMKNNRISKI